MKITDITVLDDHSTASEYLIELALVTGNGKMLRAIKTLMDAASRPTTAAPNAATCKALERSPVTVWGITPPERQLQAVLDDFDDIEHDFDDEELDDEEAAL